MISQPYRRWLCCASLGTALYSTSEAGCVANSSLALKGHLAAMIAIGLAFY
jgi:hypothetical protein